MLDNITSMLVDKLVERKYGGDKNKIPTVDYLGAAPAPVSLPAGVEAKKEKNAIAFTVGAAVPSTEAWLEALAGPKLSWLRAFLTSTTIIQGTSYLDNPIRRLFAPRAGQKAVVQLSGAAPVGVKLYGAARSHGVHKPAFEAVSVEYDAAQKLISLTIFEDRRDAAVPLRLQFRYSPETGYAPIREVAEGRNQRIKEFYWKLWFGDESSLPAIDVHETFVGPDVRIEAEEVETFCAVVGNQSEAFKSTRTDAVKAPMDFAIVTGWQVRYSLHIDLLGVH
jgi:enoyl reductase-like protein